MKSNQAKTRPDTVIITFEPRVRLDHEGPIITGHFPTKISRESKQGYSAEYEDHEKVKRIAQFHNFLHSAILQSMWRKFRLPQKSAYRQWRFGG